MERPKVRDAVDPAAADAFSSSRVGADWGHAFGTLPKGARCDEIIARSRLG